MNVLSTIDDVPRGLPLMIFGAGRGGELLNAACAAIDGIDIVAFIDNRKTGMLDGKPILSLDQFASRDPAGARILIASQFVYDIARDLRSRGIAGWCDAYPLVQSLMAREAKAAVPEPSAEHRAEALQAEVDALYALLYRIVHDLDRAPDMAALQTQDAFQTQWQEIGEGEAMLSDAWFRENVERLIVEEELLVRREWFAGKRVLDCGCGGGRWSYGLARLGARVTAVDVNPAALEATRSALAGIGAEGTFVRSSLEELDGALPPDERFDLVWCWGVLHHCRSFTDSLRQVARRVKPGGLLYLYLYGREKVPFDRDVAFFKQRVRYNALPDAEARRAFLLEQAGGDAWRVHQWHDALAPLISRRLDFPVVERLLAEAGFGRIDRVKQNPELFIRAVAKGAEGVPEDMVLADPGPPYWIQRY